MKKTVQKTSFILALFMILSIIACISVSAAEISAFSASEVTLVEGEYYIQNRYRPRYVQVDNNDKPGYSTSGSILEQWNFCGDEHQRWYISSVGGGYYKIENVKSGLVISVPSNKIGSENIALVQEPYTGADRQKWKITFTKYGSFKIKAKSSESITNKDLSMVVGDSLWGDSDGLNVEQRKYVDNDSFRDEWYLHLVIEDSGVAVEGQKKSNWCWAATARMLAKNYYSTITYTQNQAVSYVKGSEVNAAGNIIEASAAAQYYISNIPGASLNLAYDGIYTETNLKKFIDDGHVLYVMRGWYRNLNTASSRSGGHATLIYGYTKQTIMDSSGALRTKYWFLVRDPLPENEGKSYMISYEKLYNGRNACETEDSDTGIWELALVVNTSYADNTTPYYFD